MDVKSIILSSILSFLVKFQLHLTFCIRENERGPLLVAGSQIHVPQILLAYSEIMPALARSLSWYFFSFTGSSLGFLGCAYDSN
jgi:hypothetical protein